MVAGREAVVIVNDVKVDALAHCGKRKWLSAAVFAGTAKRSPNFWKTGLVGLEPRGRTVPTEMDRARFDGGLERAGWYQSTRLFVAYNAPKTACC